MCEHGIQGVKALIWIFLQQRKFTSKSKMTSKGQTLGNAVPDYTQRKPQHIFKYNKSKEEIKPTSKLLKNHSCTFVSNHSDH